MEAAQHQITSLMERIRNSQRSIGANSEQETPSCRRCGDHGFIVKNDVAYPCPCRKQRELEKMFASSEITPALRQMTFDNFDLESRTDQVKQMRQTALDYLAGYPGGWLVLLGNSGCGKTHLSMAVTNALLSRGIQCLYFQHVDGFKELKGMLQQEERINSRIDQMQRVPLLVWDDLWKRKRGVEPTSFEFEIVYDVLNYRWLNLLPTIISSERLPKQLVEIDEAIGSRILERGKGHTATVRGIENNYRLQTT